jgi:hypothetical protein
MAVYGVVSKLWLIDGVERVLIPESRFDGVFSDGLATQCWNYEGLHRNSLC